MSDNIINLNLNKLEAYSQMAEKGQKVDIKDVDKVVKKLSGALKKSDLSKDKPLKEKIQSNLSKINQFTNSKITDLKKVHFKTSDQKHEIEDLKHLSHTTKDLEKGLTDFDTTGKYHEYFTSQSSFTGPMRNYFDRFVNSLLKSVHKKFAQYLFPATQKIYDQKKEKLEKTIEKLKKDIAQLEESMGQVKDDKETYTMFEKRLEALNAALKPLTKKLEKIEEINEERFSAHRNLENIGGEAVKIKLANEDTTLDGMYFSGDEFKNKLHEAGAKKYVLTVPGEGIQVEGIAFPKEDFEDSKIASTLKELGIDSGSGWVTKEFKGQILLLKETDERILKSKWDKAEIGPLTDIDLTKHEDRPTILNTSGYKGVYTMNKTEILAFLLSGLNVMVFDFRGYGKSTGTPSDNGFKNDLEATYTYLKENKQLKDERFIVKGLCMSGGPDTYLAAKHPKINLLLDQSYGDYIGIANAETAEKEIDSWVENNLPTFAEKGSVKNKLLKWFVKHFKKHIATIGGTPDWKTREQIGKVQGNVGILLTRDDDLISLSQVGLNLESLVKSNQAKSLSIMQMPGEHGAAWMKAREAAEYDILSKDHAASVIEDFENQFLSTSIADYYSKNNPVNEGVIQTLYNQYPELKKTKNVGEFIEILKHHKKDSLASELLKFVEKNSYRFSHVNDLVLLEFQNIPSEIESHARNFEKKFKEDFLFTGKNLRELNKEIENWAKSNIKDKKLEKEFIKFIQKSLKKLTLSDIVEDLGVSLRKDKVKAKDLRATVGLNVKPLYSFLSASDRKHIEDFILQKIIHKIEHEKRGAPTGQMQMEKFLKKTNLMSSDIYKSAEIPPPLPGRKGTAYYAPLPIKDALALASLSIKFSKKAIEYLEKIYEDFVADFPEGLRKDQLDNYLLNFVDKIPLIHDEQGRVDVLYFFRMATINQNYADVYKKLSQEVQNHNLKSEPAILDALRQIIIEDPILKETSESEQSKVFESISKSVLASTPVAARNYALMDEPDAKLWIDQFVDENIEIFQNLSFIPIEEASEKAFKNPVLQDLPDFEIIYTSFLSSLTEGRITKENIEEWIDDNFRDLEMTDEVKGALIDFLKNSYTQKDISDVPDEILDTYKDVLSAMKEQTPLKGYLSKEHVDVIIKQKVLENFSDPNQQNQIIYVISQDLIPET